jgi:carbamoyl-phosphate synthase small subunit
MPFFIFGTMNSSFFQSEQKAMLLLEDGTVFHGVSIGLKGTIGGEICFNTGMTGYQEVFTDPSYFGQLMVMTNVHIGNYGIAAEPESESERIQISGLICRSFSHSFSRPGATSSLQDFLLKNKIVGISEVDTRALVRHIRSKGAMNAVISSEISSQDELKEKLKEVPSMAGLSLSASVSTDIPFDYGDPSASLKVAVLDFGIKKNILRCLAAEGFLMRVFPWDTPFEAMQEFNPDAFHLSNGPGDPAAMNAVIPDIQKIISSGKPVFGICFGHQLIAEANGIKTYKMKNGHRGINHPVLNVDTGRAEITSQNHGFSVSEHDVINHHNVKVTHINLNDKTIEGLRMENLPVFSVQYHPEAAPGPHDSRYLFKRFKSLVEELSLIAG